MDDIKLRVVTSYVGVSKDVLSPFSHTPLPRYACAAGVHGFLSSPPVAETKSTVVRPAPRNRARPQWGLQGLQQQRRGRQAAT